MNQRNDYIKWEEYFMGIAILSSMRSKDPNTQVGACIVDQNNRILSVGYNGMPNNISDEAMPWDRDNKDLLCNKYFYVVHAELNAILNYKGNNKDLEGSTIYTTLFPCEECTKAIIQSGIKNIIYLSDKYKDTTTNTAAKIMLDAAQITYSPYLSMIDHITISYK